MNNSEQGLRSVKQPKQDRSLKTLNRILNAAEALLGTRDFDALTVTDVVKKAKASVGAFYARFADKEALLDALYERNQQEAMARFETLDPAHWHGSTVEEIVRERVRVAVQLHRQNRGLYRALVLRGYAKPDKRYRDPEERDKLSVGRFATLIETHGSEIDHPHPKQAGAMAALLIMSVLRETILFSDSTASAVRLDDEQLEREIVRLVLRYLGARISASEEEL